MSQSIGESYFGGGAHATLSPAQIRKMKKNMKKVPKIQKKAKEYSEKEAHIVDKRFDTTLKNI